MEKTTKFINLIKYIFWSFFDLILIHRLLLLNFTFKNLLAYLSKHWKQCNNIHSFWSKIQIFFTKSLDLNNKKFGEKNLYFRSKWMYIVALLSMFTEVNLKVFKCKINVLWWINVSFELITNEVRFYDKNQNPFSNIKNF